VDRIYFNRLAADSKFIGQKHVLPGSKDLMEEMIVAERPIHATETTFEYHFAKPLQVLALWLSSDGDDSGSRFDLLIKSLSLDVE
jgi:hypothetical protein